MEPVEPPKPGENPPVAPTPTPTPEPPPAPKTEEGEPVWAKRLTDSIDQLNRNLTAEKTPSAPASPAPLVVEQPPLPAVAEAKKAKKSKSVPARRFKRGSSA